MNSEKTTHHFCVGNSYDILKKIPKNKINILI